MIYGNLSQETKDKMAWNRDNISFTKNIQKGRHKELLIKERGHQCEDCKNITWKNVLIPLELHHIDGDNKNQEKSNLQLLCPNCHVYTDTYRGKNINLGIKQVEDEEIITLIKTGLNNHQVLLRLNMAAKGGNYKRLYKLRDMVPTVGFEPTTEGF